MIYDVTCSQIPVEIRSVYSSRRKNTDVTGRSENNSLLPLLRWHKNAVVNIKPQKDVRQIDVAVLSEAVSKRGTGENKEGSDQLYDTVYTNATFIIRQRLLFCLV